MTRLYPLLILIASFLTSCKQNGTSFHYDPTVPYPILNEGDFWPDKFDQRGLQNAIIYRDRIYCNTIDVGGDNNFLYCLNPKDGLVIWRGKVAAYASQPVSFQNDTVIYSSYTGDISTFNKDGKILWKTKFNHPYGGHWIDTLQSKLLVKTVYWKTVNVYDIKNGKLISENENDSLQQLVERKMNDNRFPENHQYQFLKNGKAYVIECRKARSDEVENYIIQIKLLTQGETLPKSGN